MAGKTGRERGSPNDRRRSGMGKGKEIMPFSEFPDLRRSRGISRKEEGRIKERRIKINMGKGYGRALPANPFPCGI